MVKKMTQTENGLALLLDAFHTMEDPRSGHGRVHTLDTILMVAIVAIICGADDWVEVESFGKSKIDFFQRHLGVALRGIPSHDTFGRVFSLIDTEAFEHCFVSWSSQLCEWDEKLINIDGKTLRRSMDGENRAAHMVSAWANRNRLVLGQIRTADKSNEITAIPQLLGLLAIQGAIITIDAMGAQTAIAKQIIDSQADYVVGVKENQKNLEEEVRESFYKVGAKHKAQTHQMIEVDHGRIETRKCYAMEVEGYLTDKLIGNWEGLQTMILIESEVEYKNGKKAGQVMKEQRLYISSLPAQAERLNHAIRSHWGIETSLHWVLDVAFREDDNRTRIGNAPANLAIMRHIALNKLRRETSTKIGVKAKRKKAGWDHSYLLKVLRA